MAAIGIFELTAIASGAIQSDDVLAMVDVHDTAQAAQGSTRKVTLATLYLTQTTAVTVDTPLPNIAQTWNNGAQQFTAVRLNVTNTASAATSMLLDLQVGGVSQFKVSKAGAITALGALDLGSLVLLGNLTMRLALNVSVGNIATSGSTALLTPAGTTILSPLRITHGVAPTAPVDGDTWSTTAGLFIRINGVTKSVNLT